MTAELERAMNRDLLAGAVILEIAHPLTEFGGELLAGLGAEVYLVEPPGGVSTRRRRPYLEAATVSRESIPFLARNLGKRSVVIDAGSATDRELLARLAARADGILSCASAPLAALLDRPATPMATITDADGYGGASLLCFAAGGGLSSSGWPHQPPTNAPSFLGLDAAGIYAAVMLLAAMRSAGLSGGPHAYEVRATDAAVAASTPWTRPLHSFGRSAAGQGVQAGRPGSGPYPVIPCRDGYIRMLAGTPRQWAGWLELLGNPAVLSTPEWDDAAHRAAHLDAMVAVASELLADRAMADLFHEGQRLGVTITPVLDIAHFMADPHVAAREVFTTLDDPDAGPMRIVRPPFRLDGQSFPGWLPAPALDADREAAFARGSEARAGRRTGPSIDPLRPLAGIRVLNCGTGAVVPEAASLLALLGAEVIKIESRRNLDFLRRAGLVTNGDCNQSVTFNQLNLGVLSLAVDMSTEDGRRVVRELVPHCDIVMENMRSPVMGKWGLSYEEVRALRPDVIYLSSQGLGAGPYDGYQTYGPNLQAFSGVTSVWAHPDDPYPVGSTLNHPDHVAGKIALAPLLAALARRDRTGEGAYLDCAQFEAASALIADKYLLQQLAPGHAGPHGNRSPDMAPHGCYPCAGDDAWCAIAVQDDGQWAALAALLGERWRTDPGLVTAEGRLERLAAVDEAVRAWTSCRPAAEVIGTLWEAGVPCAKVRTGNDLAADRAAHEDGLFPCIAHPAAGSGYYTGLPVLAGGRRVPSRRPPLLGEHDEYVLYDVLGKSPSEAAALVASRAVGY